MNFYHELDSAENLFVTELFEPEQNTLLFSIALGQVAKEPENIRIGNLDLGPVYAIETVESSEYAVRFGSYICFNVINESFETIDSPHVYSGNKIRVYTDSHFLNYIKADTFASADYPGDFKHYMFITNNHIINVVSVVEPEIWKRSTI